MQKISAFLILFLLASPAWAFPEMVRHGYPNCIACHISPTGGGVLNAYGRQISKELLSTWGVDNEQRFLYIVQPPDWLAPGGDLKYLALGESAGGVTTNQWIDMEQDGEVAVTVGQFTADVAAGFQQYPTEADPTQFFSRRYFLSYRPTDELVFRAGRFFPAYGIYIPEHVALIRRGLGWDEGMETYNVEASYLGEKYNFQIEGILGRPDNPGLYREQGTSMTGAINITDTMKLGASYYYGYSLLTSHQFAGPYAILGFTPHFFLLSQADFERSFAYTDQAPHYGLDDYQRLDYEIVQGLHVYVTQEFQQTDMTIGSTRQDNYWFGIQFFPRPHWEFQAFWEKQFFALASPPADVYAFYIHFYP
jgi:hypothetical protein